MSEPNEQRSLVDDRFRDTQETLYDFTEEYLVVCPQCGRCARVRPIDPESIGYRAPRRVVCLSCSYTKDWHGDALSIGQAADAYFGLPLWLQTEVGDRTLWAHSDRHLQFIKSFVQATIRERHDKPGQGWRNQSVISRLPEWIKLAKNRKRVLKAIGLLEDTIVQCN
jgi:hypothetical protein